MDVAIIGASVSGATLASCLGNQGFTIALVDKERFPRRKACGEGLSNIAMDSLKRQGVDVELLIEKGLPYYAYRIDVGRRPFSFATRKKKVLRGIGIQRSILDKAIVDRATKMSGVKTFTGSAVEEISETNGYHVMVLANGNQIRARHLVLADGVHSPSAGKLGIPKLRNGEPLWGINFVIEGRFATVPEEVLVVLKEGFEINCTPVSSTKLNVTILTDRANVKRLQSSENQRDLLLEAAEKCGFTGETVLPPLQIGPVNSTRRSFVFRDSIWLVGDAAETLDPVAGMGMTFGILLAEAASAHINSIYRDGVSPRVAARRYKRQAERLSKPLRGFTRLTAFSLRNSARKVLLPPLASTPFPGLIREGLDEVLGGIHPIRFLSRCFLCLMGTSTKSGIL